MALILRVSLNPCGRSFQLDCSEINSGLGSENLLPDFDLIWEELGLVLEMVRTG